MIKKKKYLPIVICFIVWVSMFLCGCDDEGIYSNVDMNIAQEMMRDNAIGSTKYISAERYLAACEKMKLGAIPVVIISIIAGIIICKIFKNDKPIQKKAIGGLIIGIPSLVILIVFGSCYLYGKLF